MTNYTKEKITLEPSSMRKLNYILSKKDRNKLFDECSYYKSIYSGLDDTILLNALINKYVNMKIHNRIYMRNDKDLKKHR
jgi:hypothetical protein